MPGFPAALEANQNGAPSDEAGWVVTVDGDRVASGASIGALEEALRRWLEGKEKGPAATR